MVRKMTVKNVRIIVGQYAYACIDLVGGLCDIRLNSGKSAPDSLRQSASEYRAQADLLMIKAQIAEDAAQFLETKKGK